MLNSGWQLLFALPPSVIRKNYHFFWPLEQLFIFSIYEKYIKLVQRYLRKALSDLRQLHTRLLDHR